jgi:transcriptional regulator with XRE-family HTH domain
MSIEGRIRNNAKMRYSAQIRAARALLGWSQDWLAEKAGVGLATLRRIEQIEGMVKGNFSTIVKIQQALERAGIHFIENDSGEIGVSFKIRVVGGNADSAGVRLRKNVKKQSGK